MVIQFKKHQLFVEHSCLSAVQEAAKEAGVRAEVEGYPLDRSTWVSQLAGFSKSPDLMTFILPNEWLEDEFDPERAKDFLAVIRSGILKIGIWGYTPVFALPFPAIGIVLDRGSEVRSALLLHLSSASFPGVHNGLVPGSFICAERLGSELEIGRSMDRLINNIYQRGIVFKKKSMKVRVGITAVLGYAMDELGQSTKLNPPTIQVGASQSRISVSIKWKSKNAHFENWINVNPPFDLCLKAADAFLIHFLPESNNIELLMIFSDQAPDYEVSPFPIGYDYFTTLRRQALKDREGLIQKEDYNYGTFRNLSESVEQKPEPSAGGAESEGIITSFKALISGKAGQDPFNTEEDFAPFGDPKLAAELKGLKSETEKTLLTNKYLENKVLMLSKALTTVVEAVKVVKDDIKKQKEANALLIKEKQEIVIELEEAKLREIDALNKMAFCMDIMKSLKSRVAELELEKKKMAG